MFYLLTLTVCACACDAYKILVVFPLPTRSHDNLGQGVIRNLLKAGHEVTYITPYVKESTNPKLQQIDVSDNILYMPEINITAIMNKETDMFDLSKIYNMTVGIFLKTVHNPNVQTLLMDPTATFDLVIADWTFNELTASFATVYDCLYIWLSPTEPHTAILSLIDDHLNPAYNPGLMSSGTAPNTYFERAKGLFMSVITTIVKDVYFAELERKEYEKIFGPIFARRGRTLPGYYDYKYNASLVLGNSYVSMGEATRLPQNYKAIGGYHIDTDIKPLPNDLKNLLDHAKHGIIYFSMGSIVKSKDLPDELKRDLLKMFGSLKQTVLWKFEQTLPNLPTNVRILKWAPQPAILSHPNCILFITHGGLLSSTEAIHFGKPTIGIPVMGDQFTNVERFVGKGLGKRVDLSLNMANDLKIAIQDILADPSYTKRAKELSFIYHHRPVSPGAELVHWVEHIIKTRGAPHLRSPALKVPFYQKFYLDLAATILAVIIVFRCICKSVIIRCCRRQTKDSDKKNK